MSHTCRYDQSYFLEPALLPKLEYQSLMLSKESSVDGQLDALSVKYLRDEQLAVLQKIRLEGGSVDKLMATSADSSLLLPNQKYQSFATQQYLKRYGLYSDAQEAQQLPRALLHENYNDNSDQGSGADERQPFHQNLYTSPQPTTPRSQQPILNPELCKLPPLD